MDYAESVQVLQSGQQLHGDAVACAVREVLCCVHPLAVAQELVEIAVRLLESEDSLPTLAVRLEDVQQFHDVGVVLSPYGS